MWVIRKRGSDRILLILTYVDDVLIMAEKEDVQRWSDRIRQIPSGLEATSPPGSWYGAISGGGWKLESFPGQLRPGLADQES